MAHPLLSVLLSVSLMDVLLQPSMLHHDVLKPLMCHFDVI